MEIWSLLLIVHMQLRQDASLLKKPMLLPPQVYALLNMKAALIAMLLFTTSLSNTQGEIFISAINDPRVV